LTGDNTISWSVGATRGATTDNFITVNGVITVTNTGTANATIGNIVVNLQKPRTGPNTGACRNIPWVSAAADVATAFSGDSATSAKIVAAASQEDAACNAAQGPPNYVVSGAQGTFNETTGSGSLEFKDASDNSVFSLQPQVSLNPNQSITLLYTAMFDNTVLGLPVGSSVRAEAMVTFGNSGARGGSGSSATNIDIDGDDCTDSSTASLCGNHDGDEANVRTVPCRVTKTIPGLQKGNDTVKLSDLFPDDVAVTGTGVAVGSPNGFGSSNISATTNVNLSIVETCTPPDGVATITNTAHLDGQSSSVIVQGPQIGTDPITGLPIYQSFEFACVTGVALDAPANADVTCGGELPKEPNACTYTKGGYGGPGVPGQIFDNNFSTVFSTGLTIGIEDAGGAKHDATWSNTTAGKTALKTYLTSAAGGANTALTADTDNATSTSGGNLPRQTAALTLNVGFAIGSDNTVGTGNLGSLQLCNLAVGSVIGSFTLTAVQAAALNGTSVSQVLTDANNALGGNGLPSYVSSFGNLNELATALNESFDNCNESAFATANLCVAP